MIQDEMKNEFLILSPSDDGSIMVNNDQKENSFRVGKRMKISHPKQPSYQVEEDKTPAFEVFDLKAHKESKGITWKFRDQMQQKNIKINITEMNTQKKVILFIDKLKQHFSIGNKQQQKILNSLLFSPLNTGKKVYKNSPYPILNIIWDTIILFFCSLLLIISPIEYIYQQNDYQQYLYIIMIILCILDQIYKYTSQLCQEEQEYNNKKFLEHIVYSQKILIDLSCIIIIIVLIVSNNEIFKTISMILIKFIIFRKIFLTYNKRLYYELSDLKIQIMQILLTCHFFTCIYLRQQYIINQEIKKLEDIFGDYLETYFNYIIQFGNAKFNLEGDQLLYRIFNISTNLILLYYKILLLKLIILDSLDYLQEYKKIKDLKLLQRFLYQQKISEILKSQISQKLDQIFQRDKNQQIIENYFESCLEKEQIFQEFKEQKLINFVNQFKIFSKFSKSTKQQIAQNLIPVILNVNDKLICNQFGDQYNIYLLNQGKVTSGLTDALIEYQQIFSGQCFGQYSFFTGQENKDLITCLDYCLIYKLSREKFLKIISSNVKDLELATFIKDQILFNNNYQIIDQGCLYCQDITHIIKNCPKIHKVRKNTDFYDQYLYSQDQNRISYNRRRKQNQEYFRNHFRKLYEMQINNVSNEEASSEFNQLSSSDLEQNLDKKESKFNGELSNFLLNDICNENMKQSGQKELTYQEIISPTTSYQQQQQQKLQSKNIFDLKISNLLNKGNSLKIIPTSSSNPSPIVRIQNPSLPTVTEFLTIVNEEDIYKVDLDKMQDFEIYYPEYNIIIVLFKMKINQRRNKEFKSKITINQSVSMKIGKIIDRSIQCSII